MLTRLSIAIFVLTHGIAMLTAQDVEIGCSAASATTSHPHAELESIAPFCESCRATDSTRWNESGEDEQFWNRPSRARLFEEFSALLAMDGSKQPQDLGVNANAGLQASMNWGLPLWINRGIGVQVGTNLTATQNAVRVFEVLGETTTRSQSFTTVGAFQRFDNGFSWGGVHDFLYQDSYDHYFLGQWRLRAAYTAGEQDEIGATTHLRSTWDTGNWVGQTPITLRSINQTSGYWRRFWQTGAQTSLWLGLADRHSEDNIVTGPSAAKDDSFLFGADVLMPLTASLAIYGETNMIMPFDTGTVDAFLGVQWYPGSCVRQARRGKFSPLLPTASPVAFSTDWSR